MTNSQDPSAVLARLKQIEKDVFDCCDAVQNALGTLNPDRSEREAKAVEYLKEWTPTWMREETFTINEIPEKLGTAEIASLCLEQAEEIKRLRGALRDAKESACGNDDCDCCMSSYNIAFQALSPQSK